VHFHQLSYANDSQPRLKRWVIRSIEGMSGRNRFFRLYEVWRQEIVPTGDQIFGRMLDLINIKLNVSQDRPVYVVPEGPLVMIANHPFGIGDGLAILSLAENLGRPFKVLIHKDLLKISEMQPFALPVSFEESREAIALNLETRKEAVRLLKEGTTIVVFPAGGVATAPRGFGRAVDLPWKMFPARLIQAAQASVVPVYFSGQNGRAFHIASKLSMTLRLSMLVREFKKLSGRAITAKIGDVLSWQELAGHKDRKDLLAFLQNAVLALGAGEDEQRELKGIRRRRVMAVLH
jgi:putative hemolysin